jgi:predicted dehydrogenase
MKLDRRTFVKGAAAMALLGVGSGTARASEGKEGTVGKKIRVGNIGTGARGTELVSGILQFPDVEVTALCDIDKGRLDNACNIVKDVTGKRPEPYTGDEHAYRKMLERDDLDGVMICTPIEWHIPMSVDAMKAGKHVGSEVTAGEDLEGLWDLVRTKEATGRRYMLLENYAYTPDNMMIANMMAQSIFGFPYYAECAYVHDCRNLRFNPDGTLTWRGRSVRDNYGNSYATHALGPVAKWMGLNDGDRMERLTCMMTRPRTMHEYAVKKFGENSEPAKVDFKLGEMVSTLIHTAEGRVIRVDLDVHSPRPMSIYYLAQGTKGCWDTRSGMFVEGRTKDDRWESPDAYREEYQHPWFKKWGEPAAKTGHWGGDYFVLYDFVRMLKTGREPWIDVYDAATWSSLYHCTRQSLDNGSAPVEMPDFTGGRWKQKDWRKESLKPVLDKV